MSTKPKTLLYRDTLAAVEQRIVDALPEIVDGLIGQAKGGDAKAAVYLCDRILGRVASSAVAPAHDRRLPYMEVDFGLDLAERDDDAMLQRLLSTNGAGRGV